MSKFSPEIEAKLALMMHTTGVQPKVYDKSIRVKNNSNVKVPSPDCLTCNRILATKAPESAKCRLICGKITATKKRK